MDNTFDLELSAYTPGEGAVEPEGVTLRLSDGREVYADFNPGYVEGEHDDLYGICKTNAYGAHMLDKMYGDPVKGLTMEDFHGAEVTGIHVRCGREQDLYYEPISASVGVLMNDHRSVTTRLYLSDEVEVHAADYGGNGWSVAGKKPGLDQIIADAQARSAASQGKGKEHEAERG